jgi:ATP-dependent DNA helicase RecG
LVNTSFNGVYNGTSEIELWGEHEKPVCHASSVSINRNFNKQSVTNRAINKMMQQLFIETQALFIETLLT